jgi:hypothetical protein
VAYGHLDLLELEDMEIVTRAEFIRSLGGQTGPEQWLVDILKSATDSEVTIGVVNPSILLESFQTLFFSEPEVFQRYLDGDEIPFSMAIERQMRTVLITDIGNSLLELKPNRFFKFWVWTLRHECS